MDNVKPITKWQDGAGKLYDTEAEAIVGEARRVIKIIVSDATRGGCVDVDMLVERRNALVDALGKVERGRG